MSDIRTGDSKGRRRYGGWLLLVLTAILVYVLDHPIGALPALGRLLDPVNGCWANAEPVKEDYNAVLKLQGVKQPVTVWFDDRLVPHIHATNDHDVFYAEGYLHAYFRLWQMDMQTRAAAGRLSEVVGERTLTYDRKQRRKGMGYAAEQSLKAMEEEPHTRVMMDAYTAGVNAYIATLNYRSLPLEYKLMGFKPEQWTNLKSALLLKYMADDLSGKTDDIALTYLKDVMPKEELEFLFPDKIAGSTPVIPSGTVFDKPSMSIPAAPSDSIAFPKFSTGDFGERPEDGKGSNNWVVCGTRTASGAPILCNDPHLGLNLPALWYEVQLQTPAMNTYGASLPGAPGVILGFNDSVSWGFTNNYRDVKDFYLITPVAGNKDKYLFAGKELEFSKRVEQIGVKGKPSITDTVRYTIHGPVLYDEHFSEENGMKQMLAVCWMAHRPTNELAAVYGMNRAKNYHEFVDAILHFECPAQNIAYADRQGNISLWGQGQYVNKWKGQGKYVMNGSDSATLWGELIPMRENPHVLNPQQGFVSSANQNVTDSTYPYWYDGSFVELRAWRINQRLNEIQKATVKDMFTLQNDTYSTLAANVLPVMLRHVGDVQGKGAVYIDLLKKWNYYLDIQGEAPTVFQVWWSYFYREVWQQKFKHVPNDLLPLPERTMQLLIADTGTQGKVADFKKAAVSSFKTATDSLSKLDRNSMKWYNAKNTSVNHLLKLPAFSYDHMKTGGWGNAVNAMKGTHGPSWRLVVQMGKEIEAYGVYPGGQSGNPGSKYYATFLQYWADGNYYRLQFFPNKEQQNNDAVKYVWHLGKG